MIEIRRRWRRIVVRRLLALWRAVCCSATMYSARHWLPHVLATACSSAHRRTRQIKPDLSPIDLDPLHLPKGEGSLFSRDELDVAEPLRMTDSAVHREERPDDLAADGERLFEHLFGRLVAEIPAEEDGRGGRGGTREACEGGSEDGLTVGMHA